MRSLLAAVGDAISNQGNAAIPDADGGSLDRNLLRLDAFGGKRCSDTQRRHVSVAGTHERRDPARDAIIVKRQKIVTER